MYIFSAYIKNIANPDKNYQVEVFVYSELLGTVTS